MQPNFSGQPTIAGVARLMTTAAIIAIATPAAAQDATRGGTFLGRLILGAGQQKVAIDTPQAVTAVEQDDIDREQPATVGQILLNVPGVQAAGSDRPLGTAFNIRGIGTTEQTASEARIIVNVDGVPKFYEQYRLGSFFSDPELYRRVEVLRGPGSAVLYGSGAIGGTVNFETKDAGDFIPEGKTGAARLKLGYESNGDALMGSAILALRTAPGAEFLAALGYRTSNDYKDGAGTTIRGSEFSSPSALVKGTFRLGETQTLRLSVQRFESNDDNATLSQTGGGNVIADAFGLVRRDTTDTTISAVWQATTDLAWLNPKVQLAYSDTSVSQRDARNLAGVPQTCLPVASNANVFCDVDYAYRTTMLKVENTATQQGAGWENFLTVGLQATNQKRVADSSGPLGFHPEGTDRKFGIYAQSELVIGERLTLVPGARIDFGTRDPSANVPGAARVKDEATALTFAALYKITDDLSVFGSVARTERLPTLDELYSWSATKAPALSLEKEKATSFELGLAWSHQGLFSADDSLQIKATVFRNRIDNLITTTPTVDTVFHRNLARAHFKGAEIEAGYETDRFFGRLAYSQVSGKDSDFGYTIATTPAESLALTLGGRVPDRGIEYGWRGNFADRITTATRSTATGVITSTRYAGYATHDLFLGWKPQSGALEGVSVQLAVENVFDRDYRNNLSADRGRGRTFKVSLAKALTW
ncbi:MAG: TonB-dependent receptor [Pseudotabrizicola sp.]|uniref:TonB-dependent receptor domain-containing protein n=1 Tax=Pseudotabrizicola sp. TaxID=2939647 RepID=UPI00272F9127|nr:TonB-dependent receptor [Pseudotabrizicola sp.]MDP2081411.1 TonB-dependent receptor [Pseudotabrizicola sp.]MDZ7572924.1 TonB-dependent receptor [Pseudotabrizicola sp.]